MSDVWRICVVEANPSLNHSLVNTLRKDGYMVQGVVNSADAMRILWSEEFNIVICDLQLPGADGFELLRWLRTYRSEVCAQLCWVSLVQVESIHNVYRPWRAERSAI